MSATTVLGRTGITMTEIGLGAWAIGGRGYGAVDAADARAVLRAYAEAGGNFIDTATRYGESERYIGEFLAEGRDRGRFVIASKSPATEEAAIREDVELSLRRLGTDYVDLYYLHSPPDDPDTMQRALDAYLKLKDEGKIRAIGASIKGPNVTEATVALCRQYIQTGKVDALQVIYSIFRQLNGTMFAEAGAAGVAIIARTNLESGFLTGKFQPGHVFPEGDHRRRWQDKLDQMLEAVAEAEQFVPQSPYEMLSQLALRFALDAPGVTAIIPGAKRVEHVAANMAIADLPPLPDTLRAALNAHFIERTALFNTA